MTLKLLKCISESLCKLVTLQTEQAPCVKPDVTHVLVSGRDISIPAGLKSVTINNVAGVTSIDGVFELGTGRRVDSISFNATESDCVTGLLPAFTLLGGRWQWVGLEEVE